MDLIEILKGARNRIETAEYLVDCYYISDTTNHGKCMCAVGHILVEMGATEKELNELEVAYINEIDLKELKVLHEEVGVLINYKDLIHELQEINDDSCGSERKEKVIDKIDEIISKLESEQK
jgi:hypothetical protein